MEQKNGKKGKTSYGNTKRKSPARNWCFTWNNYSDADLSNIITFFDENQASYIIGKEKGELGTPHLQGYVEFKKYIRIEECKKISPKIHWEKRLGTQEQAIKYCMKENDFIYKDIRLPKILKILSRDQLKVWQLSILDIIKEDADERTIHWYYDTKGLSGKTQFCKYLAYHHGAIPINGKKNDILYCAAEYDSDIYILDIERSFTENVPYGAIEKVKDGFYMCQKYESKPIIRNSPHIFIFANFEPDTIMLSSDRWHIVNLDN